MAVRTPDRHLTFGRSAVYSTASTGIYTIVHYGVLDDATDSAGGDKSRVDAVVVGDGALASVVQRAGRGFKGEPLGGVGGKRAR